MVHGRRVGAELRSGIAWSPDTDCQDDDPITISQLNRVWQTVWKLPLVQHPLFALRCHMSTYPALPCSFTTKVLGPDGPFVVSPEFVERKTI